MPWSLKRFHETGQLHFLTFSGYKRRPNFDTVASKDTFESALERVRQKCKLCVFGFVVMPEHIHLLARRLAQRATDSFWQARYYDFNVWSEHKFVGKFRYIHRNPVARGLVAAPADWPWSSFRHYLSGEKGVVEIESQWTARKREQQGIFSAVRIRSPAENPAQVKLERGTLRDGADNKRLILTEGRYPR